MVKQTYPNFSGQPGQRFDTMVVNENLVSPSVQSSLGLDLRGAQLATVKYTGLNGIYQVNFLYGYPDVPMVVPVSNTFDTGIDILNITTTGFQFQTTVRDVSGTPVVTATVGFLIVTYSSTQVFS
jgi:hypothetical protein